LRGVNAAFIFVVLWLTATGANGQREPDRGFVAAGSYALSNIETINTTNGNLIFNIPLASLPPGPGPGFTLNMMYNSKLYNSHGHTGEDGDPVDGYPEPGGGGPQPGTHYEYELIEPGEDGGWQLGIGYQLRLTNRFEFEPVENQSCSDPTGNAKLRYTWRLRMKFPDGSVHEFIPLGYSAFFGDGYYNVDPNGFEHGCNGTHVLTSGSMTYYSTDGSFARLEITHTSSGNGLSNPWTLYFADGRKVVNTGDPEAEYGQRVYDRNDNYVQFGTGSFGGYTGTKISDQYGRSIILDAEGVHSWGVGGEHLLTTISWKGVWVHQPYNPAVSWPNAPSYIEDGHLYTSFSMVDEITLPVTGLKYKFEYNGSDTDPGWGTFTSGFGEVSKVTLPSVAFAEYTWVGGAVDEYPSEKRLTYNREYDGSSTPTTETWIYSMGGFGTFGGASTVTGPDSGVTYDSTDQGYSWKTTQPDGTVTERIWAENGYGGMPIGGPHVNRYVKTEFTTIKNYAGSPALTAIKDYTYDRNGNVLSVREYDWVSASSIPRDGNGRITGTGIPSGAVLKRETVNEYYNQSPNAGTTNYPSDPTIYSNAIAPRFLRALKSSEVRDGSGTPKSRTVYIYDDENDTANPTQVWQWDSTKGAYSTTLSSSNAIGTATTYNSKGQPTLVTDPNGNQTQITYSYVSGPSGNVVDLYPTQTVNAYNTAVAKTATAVYDYSTGVATTSTDVDNGVSTVTTYDEFGRPVLIKAASGKSEETRTSITYDDEERRVITRSDLNVAGDGKIVNIQHYDQLGRVRLSRMLEDSATQSATAETDGIKVQTRYGIASGYSFQISSNPYRAVSSSSASAEPTMGWTRSKSFTNGNLAEVETFSGTSLPAPLGSNSGSTGVVTTLRDANKTYVRDQADKWRMSETNAVGQLVKLTEDPTSSISGHTHTGTNLLAEYSYDTLSNLIGVSMAYTGGTQTRSFTYSTVGRLLSAANPESGTIAYTYDGTGNLTHKQDARGVDTSYAYDALNRPITRTYDDGTPAVTYTYDSSSVPYGSGRLTSISAKVGSVNVSTTGYTKYDALGKIMESTQLTDGLTVCSGGTATCSMSYKYNLAGALTEETYPSGRIVLHNYAADGKLTTVSSRVAANRPFKSYAQAFTYHAAGGVTDMQLGNMRWESTQFNSRLQPTQIALGTTPGATNLLDLDYSYGSSANNGNVQSQTISVLSVGTTPGFVATQSYVYDDLNRLKSAEEVSTPTGGSQGPSWKQTYLYDRFGNRRFNITGGATTTIPGTCSPAVCNPTFDLSNNRFAGGQGYVYDDAGSVTQDAEGKKFVYDGENKQTSFGVGGSSTNGGAYVYDAEGHRVKKQVGSEVTIFVYNAAGQTVAEYATTAPTSPQVNYLTADTLGSPRINTNATGAVVARHDYMPYGEEILTAGNRASGIGYGDDAIRKKFTGYERDEESGLDFAQARTYSSSLGRFTSPDPLLSSARIENPATWNRYLYVLGNPLRFVDPLGLFEWDESAGGSATDADLEGQEKDKSLSKKDRNRAKKALKFRKRFRAARELAINAVNASNLSDEEKSKALTALGAYGEENDHNGVLLARGGSCGSDCGAATLLNQDGTTTVTFVDGKEGASMAIAIGHEGQHVHDIDAYLASGHQPLFQVDLTMRDREIRAYEITSFLAQAFGRKSEIASVPEKKFQVWNRGWAKLDETERNVRRANGILALVSSSYVRYPQTEPGGKYSDQFKPNR
jgi:RHS repeat-associated protein